MKEIWKNVYLALILAAVIFLASGCSDNGGNDTNKPDRLPRGIQDVKRWGFCYPTMIEKGENGMVYVSYVSQLAAFNSTDLTELRFVGDLWVHEQINDFKVRGTNAYLYVNNKGLWTVDLGNPEQMTVIGRYDITDTIAYYICYEKMRCW